MNGEDQRWSRRRFLQLAGAASVSGFFAACGSEPETGLDGTADRVIIVGAGFAGLTVANALRQAGVDIVVIEARDRIGGRMFTADVDGAAVDLGAAWIHGIDGNPVKCFATANGIGSRAAEFVDNQLSGFDAQSGSLPPDLIQSRLAGVVGFSQELPQLRMTLGPNASLADGARLFLDSHGITGDRRRQLDFGIERALGELFIGGASEDISLAYFTSFLDEEFTGGNQFPNGGYSGVVRAMARGISVRTNECVERVAYDAGGVNVTTTRGSYRGSHAVVTVPLGVLQSGVIQFSPSLPQAKLDAIRRLGMGMFEKVILRFERAFWLEAGRPNFLYLSSTPGEFPAYLDLTSFVGVPTLLCFYGGGFVRSAALLSDAEIINRVRAILGDIFQMSVPQPTAVRLTRWLTDPYVRGSFSFIPVGATEQDQVALGEPVAGRLCFAGEATVPVHYGTVHAAMLSGLREAKRVLGKESVMLNGQPAPEPGCQSS